MTADVIVQYKPLWFQVLHYIVMLPYLNNASTKIWKKNLLKKTVFIKNYKHIHIKGL